MSRPSHPSASVVFVQSHLHRTEQKRQSVRVTACALVGVALTACAPPAATRGQPHLLGPQPFATSRAQPVAAVVFSGPAPIIVQIENSPASRPQSGLSDAAIVYEYVAEGGVGRLSAIFALPPAVQVGPVRSARLVTIALLQLYTGVLLYSGASTYIQGQLAASHRPHYDEDSAGGDLFRIAARTAPYNLYTDGTHMADALRRARVAPIGYEYLRPAAGGVGGSPAAAFSVPISAQERPRWTWNAPLHGWTRSEPDTGAVTDANTSQPVVVTTVIVQQVPIAISPNVVDVNGVHGVSHTVTGSGTAQVFAGGSEYDATWSQPRTGPPTFTLADGQPAPMAPGLVWIELVAIGAPAPIG